MHKTSDYYHWSHADMYVRMCSRFMASSPVHTLHTAVTHVIIALELWSLMC